MTKYQSLACGELNGVDNVYEDDENDDHDVPLSRNACHLPHQHVSQK